MSDKKRYAIVGTGGRAVMFLDPLVRDYSQYGEMVGLCDSSLTRATYHQRRLQQEYYYREVPVFHAEAFDAMLRETRPDVVIVCTVDATHHEYIVRALNAGCDVITEKPMTTDAPKCRAIFEAVQVTGRHVRVTFNYRWTPGALKLRELLSSGVIGNVHAVNMEYQLNTSHGADYFRRWHAHKEYSGGLLVHKSTHHFDAVNWWLNAIPEEVFAWGGLKFYGKANAVARGDAEYTGHERYAHMTQGHHDPFSISLEGGSARELYQNAEIESGYIRDRNVFREGITAEDTMSVLVKYRNGTLLNYSLVAYSPLEGFRVTFTGDRGRIEYADERPPHIIDDPSKTQPAVEPGQAEERTVSLRVFPHFRPGYDVPVETASGSHGGGDALLQRQIFDPTAPADDWQRSAGHEQGAASMLIGAAANASIESGQPVVIGKLCSLPSCAKHLHELF
jgi:predicted dehydrogenase